jgi:hypothetical protein
MELLTKHKLLRHIERASGVLGLPTSEPEMRTSIIKMILATDMIFHYELQENLANLLEIIVENDQEQVVQMRKSLHTPVLPSTTEEEEEEEEECKHEMTISTSNSSSTTISHTPPSSDTFHKEHEEEDIQVKDIFSSQGAKSAISYFRKKSYFEEDTIPLCLKTMPLLPASPEDDDDDDEEENITKTSEKHHSSGVDLVTTTIKVNGVEKTLYTPPNYIMEPQQRLILCQIILHAADISNALRPWPICLSWSNLVCEEFFRQGEAERDNGLKVSPNMDRSQVSQTTIGLQFGDFVVSPYFEIFAALFPKADALLKTLAENRKQWIKMEEEIADKKQKQEQEENQRLPSSMLPDRPILNPSGRRVSVAAGMVVIPDELEERTIGSGKHKRKYWGVRSVSHSDISSLKDHRERSDVVRRRKSEEPNLVMSRKYKLTMSPSRSKKSTTAVIGQE